MRSHLSHRGKSLKRELAALALSLCVAACGSTDQPKTLGEWSTDQIQAIRGDANPVPAVVVSELATQDFPVIPDEPRPLIRSEKERNDLKTSLLSDQADGKKTRAAVEATGANTKAIPIAVPVGKGGDSPTLAADPPPAAPVVAPPTAVPPPGPPKQVAVPLPMVTPSTKTPPPDTTTAVESIYRQRLAESAAPLPVPRQLDRTDTTITSDDTAASTPSLVPPAEYRRRQAALGFQSLEAFGVPPDQPSIDVGAVKFGEGTFEMAASQSAILNNVVRLFRQNGGRISVIGHSISGRLDVNAKANREANAVLARGRAEAVARELIHLGIPGQRIYAGPAPAISPVTGVDTSGEEANIYIDY